MSTTRQAVEHVIAVFEIELRGSLLLLLGCELPDSCFVGTSSGALTTILLLRSHISIA